jgi:hypothetical protein
VVLSVTGFVCHAKFMAKSLDGVVVLIEKPARAFAGQFFENLFFREASFFERPKLRLGRSKEYILCFAPQSVEQESFGDSEFREGNFHCIRCLNTVAIGRTVIWVMLLNPVLIIGH